MKIYTKTGDDGTTGLLRGPRVSKDDPRIEAYGTVDELNAVLGLIRAEELAPEIDGILETIQHALFDMGAELATPDPIEAGLAVLQHSDVRHLETYIDRFDESLPPLKQFVLPGGTRVAAVLHLARTVCRRAERRLVSIGRDGQGVVRLELMHYLNRLSDLFFVLSRFVNAASGQEDILWQKRSSAQPSSDSSVESPPAEA